MSRDDPEGLGLVGRRFRMEGVYTHILLTDTLYGKDQYIIVKETYSS